MPLSTGAMVWGGKYGAGVYEIREDSRYAGYVSVAPLKEKGLVRRIDHTKKVNEWLNTPEGEKWFAENKRHQL